MGFKINDGDIYIGQMDNGKIPVRVKVTNSNNETFEDIVFFDTNTQTADITGTSITITTKIQ